MLADSSLNFPHWKYCWDINGQIVVKCYIACASLNTIFDIQQQRQQQQQQQQQQRKQNMYTSYLT